MQIEPYLFFDGSCEAALAFYQQCLGGQVVALHRYAGSPMEAEVPADWKNKVMHATFETQGQRFMASDWAPGRQPFGGHAGFSMSVNLPNEPARGEEIFNALAAGGKVTMPFQAMFWGAQFGSLTDKFGVSWMVNCEKTA